MALPARRLDDAAEVECFVRSIGHRVTKNHVVLLGHDHTGDFDVAQTKLDREGNLDVVRPGDQSHMGDNLFGFRDFIV